jgi:hypothetical protein
MNTFLTKFISAIINENVENDIRTYRRASEIFNWIISPESADSVAYIKIISEDNPYGSGDDMTEEEIQALLDSLDDEYLEANVLYVSFDARKMPDNLSSEIISKNFNYLDFSLTNDLSKTAFGTFSRDVEAKTLKISLFNIKNLTDADSLRKQFILAIKDKKSTVIHEITHMLDYVSNLSTKYDNIPRKSNKIPPSIRNNPTKLQSRKRKRYVNSGIELNARWSQVLQMLSDKGFLEPNSTGSFENDWLPDSKKTFKFDELSLPKKRKFIQKLHQIYMENLK